MLRNRAVLPWVIGAALALSMPASAQFGLGGNKDKDKKEAERAEKEKKADAKNVAKYEKLKEFSVNRYQTDPDFRDEVDEAFQSLLREHSDRAYQKNTSRESYIKVVHEDSWRVHTNLYDNLLVQAHINRIGQRLVPPESELAFAFKVVPDPTPLAETLATGTVYVSTGLISLLDTEAQLSYVLAHEMAHVHLQHWKERVTMQQGAEAYAVEVAKKVQKWALLGTVIGGGVGAAIGGANGNAGQGAGIGLLAGAVGGAVAGSILNRPLLVDWDRVQEDTADAMAFKAMLDAGYDVREIPALYVAMEKATLRDARVALGFLGDRRRIKQRQEKSSDLINNAYKAEIATLSAKGFVASSAEHRNLMAELKRDNGIMAYYHDMFEMARTNLAEATAIRDNDPAAHYFYGKVLGQIGRTPEELRQARDSFYKATLHDKHNQQFGAHLHLALMMAREAGVDRQQVTAEIDRYVSNYAKWQAESVALSAFPPNLDSMYEYMALYGDEKWEPKVPALDHLPQYQILNAFLQNAAPRQAEQGRTQAVPSNSAPAAPAAAPRTVTETIIDTVAPGARPAGAAAQRTVDAVGRPAAPAKQTKGK